MAELETIGPINPNFRFWLATAVELAPTNWPGWKAALRNEQPQLPGSFPSRLVAFAVRRIDGAQQFAEGNAALVLLE